MSAQNGSQAVVDADDRPAGTGEQPGVAPAATPGVDERARPTGTRLSTQRANGDGFLSEALAVGGVERVPPLPVGDQTAEEPAEPPLEPRGAVVLEGGIRHPPALAVGRGEHRLGVGRRRHPVSAAARPSETGQHVVAAHPTADVDRGVERVADPEGGEDVDVPGRSVRHDAHGRSVASLSPDVRPNRARSAPVGSGSSRVRCRPALRVLARRRGRRRCRSRSADRCGPPRAACRRRCRRARRTCSASRREGRTRAASARRPARDPSLSSRTIIRPHLSRISGRPSLLRIETGSPPSPSVTEVDPIDLLRDVIAQLDVGSSVEVGAERLRPLADEGRLALAHVACRVQRPDVQTVDDDVVGAVDGPAHRGR